jgi:hypothetical protein
MPDTLSGMMSTWPPGHHLRASTMSWTMPQVSMSTTNRPPCRHHHRGLDAVADDLTCAAQVRLGGLLFLDSGRLFGVDGR